MQSILQIEKDTSATKKVFVGLSGGVDSAVSAALLKQQGYDVTGVFIKVWTPPNLPCTWRQERRDAMRVAAKLGIPFLFFDFSDEYKKEVADYMIKEYKLGRTPNPDVMCNKVVKFGAFWREAAKHGADLIATGHYARNELRAERNKLLEAKDKNKDQSYFLWTLGQDDLSHTFFPVGGILKSEVRELAHRFDLPVSDKKDSQGICFIGEVTLEEFLHEYIDSKPGNVLNLNGEPIGTHRGAAFYTMGERHGFSITDKSPSSGAFYVVAKDMEANTITVTDNQDKLEEFSPRFIEIKDSNWISGEAELGEMDARIRYRGVRNPIVLLKRANKLIAKFAEPQRGLSLGQSIVFYRGEECLGGAILDAIIKE